MKLLEKRSKKRFHEINEWVAKFSPMRTHYHSNSFLERNIWGKKKQVVKKMLDSIKYESVIDTGCGDGGLFSLIKKNSKYIGVDISPTQLKAFKNSLDSTSNMPVLIEADVNNLPLKDKSFDVAIACDVLEHVIDPLVVIQEIKRVVKKGGHIIIGIPNENLLELVRLITLRFPLRSPDHIYAIYPSDIKKHFPNIIKKVGVPFNLFLSDLNLLNIFLVKNEG